MKINSLVLCSAISVCLVTPARGSALASDHFSRAQLVTDLRGTPGVPKADQQPSVLYKQRYAQGYLAGVMDATEGVMWCRPAAIKPGELEELVWSALQERKETTSDAGAAKEVISVLRFRFPCTRRKL
jgi:hypothetical protein